MPFSCIANAVMATPRRLWGSHSLSVLMKEEEKKNTTEIGSMSKLCTMGISIFLFS